MEKNDGMGKDREENEGEKKWRGECDWTLDM
jgi:hypothetical protein